MRRERAGDMALVGSGEFTPAMRDVDADLVRRHGPRVVLLATASAVDGEHVYADWCAAGLTHFAALGARPEALPVRTRADALDQALAGRVRKADLVYLSGGKPTYLCETLRGTPLSDAIRDAWQHGTAAAGSSAGAEALTVAAYDVEQDGLPACPGLQLVPHLAVVPHFDAWSACRPDLVQAVAERVPSVLLVGIDEDTALVGGPMEWRVCGLGGVTVVADGRQQRFRSGDALRLPALGIPRSLYGNGGSPERQRSAR